jgi:hypothetical protein
MINVKRAEIRKFIFLFINILPDSKMTIFSRPWRREAVLAMIRRLRRTVTQGKCHTLAIDAPEQK